MGLRAFQISSKMRFRLRPDQIDKVLFLKGEHLCFCVHYMDFDRKTIVFEMGQNCLTIF